ncbi:hypothetical protein D3C87_1529740 [compost metagenome]
MSFHFAFQGASEILCFRGHDFVELHHFAKFSAQDSALGAFRGVSLFHFFFKVFDAFFEWLKNSRDVFMILIRELCGLFFKDFLRQNFKLHVHALREVFLLLLRFGNSLFLILQALGEEVIFQFKCLQVGL